MEFGSYVSQQPCRTIYKPFSLLCNSSCFCIIHAHKYLHYFYSRKRKFALIPYTSITSTIPQVLKILFFFFFQQNSNLTKIMKETEDGTNTNYPGKNSKSKFREVSILEFTRLVTIRLQCSFASVNRRASAWQRSSFIPGL